MKNFKKTLALILSLAMVFSMAACGSKEAAASSAPAEASAEPAESASTPEPSVEPTASASAPDATGGTVEGALKGVKITFGTSGLFAPFSYYDDDGTTLIGFDLDFYQALKDYLGFEQEGEIQVMDYSALTTSLAEGKLDIGMAALCATDERKKVMNFTET